MIRLNKDMTVAELLRRSALPAAAVLLLSIPGAFAQEAQKPEGDITSEDEIKQFCTNIADPARDQRYLLQKQELEKLRADIDTRVAEMDKRKAEYQDWLKRRDVFLKQAEAGLTDIYKNMKPDAAAMQLEKAKTEIAAAVIMRLGPRQSSLILNEMDPEGRRHRQHHRQCIRSQYVEGSLMNKRFPAAIAAVALLAGCQSPQSVREIGRAPAMSPIGSGLAYGQTPQMALYPKQPRQVAQGYSLWSDSQAALFKDARALNVGDILTVNIQINDKAKFENDTSRSRTNSSGMNWDVNANILGWNPASKTDLTYGSDTSTDGKGKIDRSETLKLMVAAVVTGILENGNLVISGSQEVRVNQEIRILNVAGIVRPQDVNSDNQISYEKIAEARISYGGRGRLMEMQQPPRGQQAVDLFSPL